MPPPLPSSQGCCFFPFRPGKMPVGFILLTSTIRGYLFRIGARVEGSAGSRARIARAVGF